MIHNREKYDKLNREVEIFVEYYKQVENEAPLSEARVKAASVARSRIRAEFVTYKKVRTTYKGKTLYRRVVDTYNKGR